MSGRTTQQTNQSTTTQQGLLPALANISQHELASRARIIFLYQSPNSFASQAGTLECGTVLASFVKTVLLVFFFFLKISLEWGTHRLFSYIFNKRKVIGFYAGEEDCVSIISWKRIVDGSTWYFFLGTTNISSSTMDNRGQGEHKGNFS